MAGAASATQHLLDLGHETVWHIAGPPDFLEARQRVQGWRATLEQAGAQPPQPLIGDWSARAGYDLGRRLAAEPARSPRSSSPTTRWRSACCGRCTRRAAESPSEVSVVGFDDIPEAPFFTPPLTTVRQDFDEMGSRSLRLLLRTIETGERAPSGLDAWPRS